MEISPGNISRIHPNTVGQTNALYIISRVPPYFKYFTIFPFTEMSYS
jgi:hypothetical protein